jgi:hypothetical protein
VRFEVLTKVKLSVLVLWVVTPYGVVGRYQRFGETYYPLSSGLVRSSDLKMEAACFSETLFPTYMIIRSHNLIDYYPMSVKYVRNAETGGRDFPLLLFCRRATFLLVFRSYYRWILNVEGEGHESLWRNCCTPCTLKTSVIFQL